MLRQQLLSTLIWAAGSFGVVLGVGLPSASQAVNQPPATPLVQMVRAPRITVNGIELTVEQAGPATRQSVQTSHQPIIFRLRARNSSTAAATADFTLHLTSQLVRSPMARTISLPMEIWAKSGSVTLKPGQTQTLLYTTLPPTPGRIFDVNLSSGDAQITALSHSVEAMLSSTTRPAGTLQ
jgi:hypothetical protein